MPSAPPIILLASPYSHLSRVALMLGGHPDTYAPCELNLLIAERLVDFFDQTSATETHGLLRAIAQLYSGEQTLESIGMARRWVKKRAISPSSDVYQELCARVAPRRLIDASAIYTDPGYERSLERLREGWPEADYLHLVRHPLNQGLEWLRDPMALARLHQLNSRDPETPGRPPDPQFDWLRRQRLILDFLRQIPDAHQHRITTEELFANPRINLARICLWLKLDWRESAFESMLHPDRSSYARPGPYGAETGLDGEVLSQPAIPPADESPASLDQPLPWRSDGRGFRTEVADLARALGYDG